MIDLIEKHRLDLMFEDDRWWVEWADGVRPCVTGSGPTILDAVLDVRDRLPR